VSKKTFGHVDTHIFRMLWRWIKRKHPTKRVAWRRKKYFRANGTRNWVFSGVVFGKASEQKIVHLYEAQATPIKRHFKIRGKANPYDPQWESTLKNV
jgi:RNA-directed DNA polymerase